MTATPKIEHPGCNCQATVGKKHCSTYVVQGQHSQDSVRVQAPGIAAIRDSKCSLASTGLCCDSRVHVRYSAHFNPASKTRHGKLLQPEDFASTSCGQIAARTG